MLFYLFIAIGLLGATLHIALDRNARNRVRVLELLLIYLLPTAIGLTAIYAFIGHMFFSVEVAHFIGWPPGSPFQKEMAFANLSYGVLGILCIWLRGKFWLATVLGYTVLLWGAAYHHIVDIVKNHNYAPGNAGVVLYLDILVPLVLLTLLLDYYVNQRKGT